MKRYEAELRYYTYDENGTKLFSSAVYTGGPSAVLKTLKGDRKLYPKIDHDKDEIAFLSDLTANKERGGSKRFPNYVYGMPEPKDGEIYEVSALRVIDEGPLDKQNITLRIGHTRFEGQSYGNEIYTWEKVVAKEGDKIPLPLLKKDLVVGSVEEDFVLLSVEGMGEKKLYPLENVTFVRDERVAHGNTEDQVFGTVTRYMVELFLE